MLPNFERNDGLIRAIAQDSQTLEVLMDAFMDPEAFDETLRTKKAVYFSRSRRKLWRKGEESGHVQLVRSIRLNCNADAVLLQVEQVGGAACHDGYRTCYYRAWTPEGWKVVQQKVFNPQTVYKK